MSRCLGAPLVALWSAGPGASPAPAGEGKEEHPWAKTKERSPSWPIPTMLNSCAGAPCPAPPKGLGNPHRHDDARRLRLGAARSGGNQPHPPRRGGPRCRRPGRAYHCLECRDGFIAYDRPTILKAVSLVRQVRPAVVFAASPGDYLIDTRFRARSCGTLPSLSASPT